MSILFKKYKRIFRRHLQPVFAVLVARRKTMSVEAWTTLVDGTLDHVAANPIEYLGDDLPAKPLLQDILQEVRTEFVREMAVFSAVPDH